MLEKLSRNMPFKNKYWTKNYASIQSPEDNFEFHIKLKQSNLSYFSGADQ